MYFLYVLLKILNTLLVAFEIAMFARAILSWFPSGGGRFEDFLYSLTEPVISPMRNLIGKSALGGMPIDLSFLITYVLVVAAERVVSRLALMVI